MKITAYDEKYHLDLSGSGGVIAHSESHTSIGSNTPLADSGSGSVGSGPQAAPWDHVHPASGSSSFGSNSTRVSSVSAAGASSSNSRADHVHDGIATVTASSSNSLNRGTVNLRAGTGIALALSNTDGGSGFDTVTVQNIIPAGSGGGGGGSGITHSYIGYNTQGGSTENGANGTVWVKKVTLASAGMLMSVGAFISETANGTPGAFAGVLNDVAGSPERWIAAPSFAWYNALTTTAGGNYAQRWYHIAVGIYLAAGDYWLAFGSVTLNGADIQIAYDGSGTDKNWSSANGWTSDAGRYTVNTTTRKYSIRGSLIT
jgi:hypothetical protein